MAQSFIIAEIPVATVQSAIGAAYAIPADRYAVVRVNVDAGETFLVNGVVVLSSRARDITAINTSATGTTAYAYPGGVTAGKKFVGNAWSSGNTPTLTQSGFITASALPNIGAAPTVPLLDVPGGQTLSIGATGASQTKTFIGYEEGMMNTAFTQEFRLPAGSTISGGRYHVELYRIPGSET